MSGPLYAEWAQPFAELVRFLPETQKKAGNGCIRTGLTPSDYTKNYRVLRVGRRFPEGEERGPCYEAQTLKLTLSLENGIIFFIDL